MARGKSLKIFMMDGDAAGRWVCTLAGRTTKAYRIPRALQKKCCDIDELKRPAVYLLFGDEDDTGRPVVYIGETEDAYTRLKDHEDKKDYWSEAVVFVSQDDHFNKAHVKYLEGRLYEIANQVDRYTVMNTQKPTSASIAIDEQAEMEDFIDNVSVLTYGMGHKVFEPLIKKEGTSEDLSDKQVFAIRTKNNSVGAYLGTYLEPESWRCTMVASLYLGLPGSLAQVGAVLGVEKQKLEAGKDLIKYFSVPCKATKTNGGRTRNLPEHDGYYKGLHVYCEWRKCKYNECTF